MALHPELEKRMTTIDHPQKIGRGRFSPEAYLTSNNLKGLGLGLIGDSIVLTGQTIDSDQVIFVGCVILATGIKTIFSQKR